MFNELTNEQKEMLLKALALFAVQSNGRIELLETFAKYAAEGFDLMVDTEITEDTIVFKKKGEKK